MLESTTDPRDRTRLDIVEAAATLLRDGGSASVTTRAVADAAGVQAPTIYRHFGDKDGLLDAVAEHVMADYVAVKQGRSEGDPLEDLRAAWRSQIDFGLSNPDLVRLMNARDGRSPAVDAGIDVLRGLVRRLASAGLLRVSEARALGLIHAAGAGAIQALLADLPAAHDAGLADALFESVLSTITGQHPSTPAVGHTIAVANSFAASVPELPGLSAAERSLLAEWLERSIQHAERG